MNGNDGLAILISVWGVVIFGAVVGYSNVILYRLDGLKK